MKIVIAGGDGFCGWATTLRLLKDGNEVLILDNLSRRKIDDDLGIKSLTKIYSMKSRLEVANKLFGPVSFRKIDISNDYYPLTRYLSEFEPDAVIHFAEQRSAPYSMIGEKQRRLTIDNNISTTNNLLSCIVDINPKIHFLHLGTMGFYGYSDIYGKVPEGYLDIIIQQTNKKDKIVYPPNPGSIYHLSKVLDHYLLQYYKKNWNIPITDLHQGIVWGAQSLETSKDDKLTNRFDYDGIYGTVLNRFISQALNNHPLTIYGTGKQTRAFIHIDDTAECLKIALKNPPNSKKVRVFNQVSETQTLINLAKIVINIFGGEIKFIPNPRNEKESNQLKVSNKGLKSLGFKPKLISNDLIEDLASSKLKNNKNFHLEKILNSPKWS